MNFAFVCYLCIYGIPLRTKVYQTKKVYQNKLWVCFSRYRMSNDRNKKKKKDVSNVTKYGMRDIKGRSKKKGGGGNQTCSNFYCVELVPY